MRCALDHQFWRSHRKPPLLVGFCPLILIALAANMTLAQPKTDATIAVICRGADDIPADTLNALCVDLQTTLAAEYPDATFGRADAIPKDGAAFVAFEVLSATNVALDARLTSQNARTAAITGPRLGFSVTDKDLTPALQKKFLNRLVHASELPF